MADDPVYDMLGDLGDLGQALDQPQGAYEDFRVDSPESRERGVVVGESLQTPDSAARVRSRGVRTPASGSRSPRRDKGKHDKSRRDKSKSSKCRPDRGDQDKGKEPVKAGDEGGRIGMFLGAERAMSFFRSDAQLEGRPIPPLPSAVRNILGGGVRGGAILAILAMQLSAGMREYFVDLANHEDTFEEAVRQHEESSRKLADAQAKIKDLENQVNEAKAKAASKEEDLRALRVKLDLAKEEGDEAYERGRRDGVREYVAGYRGRHRADHYTIFRSGLLVRIALAQVVKRGLTNFRFDVTDFYGYSRVCPPYVPPVIGTFKGDGENPLEAWDVSELAASTGVVPSFKDKLPPQPVPVLLSAPPGKRAYERSSTDKRRALSADPAASCTLSLFCVNPPPAFALQDADMEEARASE